MLKKPEGYDEVKEFTEFEQLEAGGHELIIKDIAPVSGNSWEAIDIYFDTTRSDIQPNYFSKNHTRGGYYFGQYRLFMPDENKAGTDMYKYSVSNLKQFITSVEHSNKGFKFDWSSWDIIKGKHVGASFGEEEYFNNQGEIKKSVKLRWFCNIEKAAEQKIPRVKEVERVSTSEYLDTVKPNSELPFEL